MPMVSPVNFDSDNNVAFPNVDLQNVDLQADCMQFTDNHGHRQLLCLLEGGSTFKISCDLQGNCLEVTRKIRFIGQPFFDEIRSIRELDPKEQFTKLHLVLRREIAEGRVVFEVKRKDLANQESTTDAIVSEQFRHLLKKKYSRIEVKDEDYFAQMAEAFSNALKPALELQARYIQENKPVDPTSSKGLQKKIERNFFVEAISNWSKSLLSYLKEGTTRIFDTKQEQKFREKQNSFDRQREYETHAQKVETIERHREERRQDTMRQEKLRDARKDDDKLFSGRQEARIHRSSR